MTDFPAPTDGLVTRMDFLLPESDKNEIFVLSEWKEAGLNIETTVKRGIYTIKETLVSKRVGKLEDEDTTRLERSLREWLGLP